MGKCVFNPSEPSDDKRKMFEEAKEYFLSKFSYEKGEIKTSAITTKEGIVWEYSMVLYTNFDGDVIDKPKEE